ncbi:MAG TPA: DUF4259 domain-containing protein [Caulobacterales bacterium]|jgi:hypothetical protein|nr:DUF4259 domain-containing protein [Caulobacterales bacterium]
MKAMGAWGHMPFENDDARDLGADFVGAPNFNALYACVDIVLAHEGGYLDARDSAAAIAAGEIAAAARGKPGGGVPEDVEAAARALGAPPDDLVQRCRKALVRVQSNSELAELMAEHGELEGPWIDSIDDLLGRLS